MAKIIFLMVLIFLESCFLGHPRGYRNIEIKNLASPNLIIEGMEFRRIDKKIDGKSWGFFPAKYKDDPSTFIGISSYGIIIPDEARAKEPKFQQIGRLKIYYKSKKCLLFYLDGSNKNVFNKYQVSFLKENVLALTSKGLELLTPEQYEAAKGKYTINDKNVKCIKE